MVPEQKAKISELVDKHVEESDGVSMAHLIQSNFGKLVDPLDYENLAATLENTGKYIVNRDTWYVTRNANYKKHWYETELAKKAYQDYPVTKRLAISAIIISGAVLVLELIKWIVELSSKP